jgi:uncharacterized protein YigE (DUF2233 family)
LQHATATIVFAAINPSDHPPQISGIDETNFDGRSPYSSIVKGNAKLALGSGFVKSFSSLEPLGLLIIDGKELNPINNRGYSQIVGVSQGKLRILSLSDYKAFELEFEGAFQTGPGLIENGKIVVRPKEKFYRRSWLALCEAKVLAGVTLEPVSLFSLAAFIADPELNGGFHCQRAVNLAGGGSEVLVIKADDGLITSFGNQRRRQASYVIFR